jgi:DNA gyrase/topoisomerase IV subunit A
VGVQPTSKKDVLAVVTTGAHALICAAEEVSELAGPGRGVTVIKVGKDDEVAGFGLGAKDSDTIVVAETEGGKKIPIGPKHYEVVSRGGKGRPIAKRTRIVRVSLVEVEGDGGEGGGQGKNGGGGEGGQGKNGGGGQGGKAGGTGGKGGKLLN